MSAAPSNEDLITIKDIVRTVKSYADEVKSRWKVVIVIFTLLGSYKLYKALTTPVVYQARLSFMLSEEKGGIGGSLGSILGDFGLGKGKEYNYQKLIELAGSRKIFSRVVFDSAEVDGRKRMLANALIDEFETYGNWAKGKWYKPWEEESALKGFRFSSADISGFDRLARAALLVLHSMTRNIFHIQANEDTGILTMDTESHNEDLSRVLAEHYFNKLSEYYIRKATEKQEYTFHLLQEKVDSVRKLITNKEYQIATYQDASRGVWSHRAKVPLSKLKKEVQLLYIMLGEAVKNKEMADFALNNKTPFIQAIDMPVSPLPAVQPVWWMELIRAFIVSFLVGVLYISVMKWYHDVMKEEKPGNI